jgi:hypothetical protein
MARRYVIDSVFEAINASPIFVASNEIHEAVNKNVRLKGWNKNINTVQIGQVARILTDERRVIARRRPGKERIKEYLSVFTLRQTT